MCNEKKRKKKKKKKEERRRKKKNGLWKEETRLDTKHLIFRNFRARVSLGTILSYMPRTRNCGGRFLMLVLPRVTPTTPDVITASYVTDFTTVGHIATLFYTFGSVRL